LDTEKKRVYRIDLKKSVLEQSLNSIKWQEIGKTELINFQENDILQLYEIKCLNTANKNLVYLLMECTNQVYQFNYQTLKLERIDKTYYGGFNCRSIKFIRNNTIYSAGGYGLFRSNNLLIYYQKDRHEWDALNFLNEAPKSIFKGFSGYVKKTDSFFTGFNDFVSVSENIGKGYTDFGFYEYKFKENKWNKLGEIKQKVLRNIKKEYYQYFHWNGKYFIFRVNDGHFNNLFIIDPFLNQVYQWIDKERLFNEEIPTELENEYVHEDSLFSYKVFVTNNRNERQKFAISIEKTKKQATYIGKFYEAENNDFWLLILAIGFGLAIVSFIIYFKFFKDKNIKKYVFYSSNALHSLEIKMIEVLIQNYEIGGISSEHISDLLEIDDKTIDNQRRLKHEFIKTLNLKLKILHNIDNAIERKQSSNDKRIFNYQLNDDIVKKLKKEFKKN
jgi:hypothetical protein